MSGYEVPEPILNSPFDEPTEHWYIVEGALPERRPDRRPAMYFFLTLLPNLLVIYLGMGAD